MSFPPPKSAPTGAKSSPPAAAVKPPPKAKPSPQKGPPISAAFHAPPGAIPPAAPSGPATAPAPISQPADVNSAYSHLTGRAIAQALLGTFAQAIAQPK